MKKLYSFFKKWHKYIGIGISIILIWMSISGILLNHSNWIANYGVPTNWLPEDYVLKNWNRGGINDAIFVNENHIFLGGKFGIWESKDGGKTFHSAMNNGFTTAPYYLKTNDLLFDKKHNILYAATFEGVYKLDLSNNLWTEIKTPESTLQQFVKLIVVEDTLYAFSQSHLYTTLLASSKSLSPKHLLKDKRETMDLIQYTFALHSGWLWGFGGRVFYDILSAILIFLSISALYITFRKKRKPTDKTAKKKVNQRMGWMIKNHTVIGVYTSLFLLVIGGTGFFMRPPALVALVDGKVPVSLVPNYLLENPWYHSIRNATYNAENDEFILDTTEGIYKGKRSLEKPFVKTEWAVNIFVMGATVFESLPNHHYLIGSFYGLFDYKEGDNYSYDLLYGNKTPHYQTMKRPSDFMVMSAFTSPNGIQYISTFQQGLLTLNTPNEDSFFPMPKELLDGYKMPLWNYMFELHNGRLFSFILGKVGILFIPIVSLFFIFIIISGVYEYAYRKRKKLKSLYTKRPTSKRK
ncbi:PepSY-associated TM helix domain-containing protein [Flammeovirga agarivorans]|uniref:PepSY domain-containing protein n=1 Tax=Flammeovirga agarivorans TaxID=2726742 RepID=A0A7X8SHG3_9BACT|nr:PepSY-associated TM helix domain-containing protein [Flammeovirga agarivorans]NLR90291.1 PepSY domain-containing protein [Flammeovirga agarivorans]